MTYITIGIDISKALLDVATYPEDQYQQFTNDTKGHKALAKWLAGQMACCIESKTGRV